MANPVSKMTPDQKAWAKKLGVLVAPGSGSGKQDDERTKKSEEPAGRKTSLANNKEDLVGFSPLDIPEIIPKGAEALLGPLSATCLINNNSSEDLFLDPKSREDGQDTKDLGLSSGEYEDFPPSQIKAGDQNSKFKAINVPINLIIIKPRFKGVTGRVRYFIGADKKTAWTITFDNPRSPGGNEASAVVEGANAAKFEQNKPKAGGGADAKFLFILEQKGGVQPTPGPSPGPAPTPAQDVPSSCRITVTNNSQQPLALAEQDHERGAFMSFPAKSIPPGGNSTFISVETPNNKAAKDEGCKGFVVWEVGSPAVATWRIEWDNPEGEKNTVKSTLTPQSAGFKAVAQIAQGEENVPAEFTLSGGGQGPSPNPEPNPQPGPQPAPEPEPEFVAPPGSRQPTLRLRDKDSDGWVEYLQVQLNHHLGIKLEVDGNFGPATHKAVITFQQKLKLEKVDGIVGNETWSALREGPREKPGTDGRQPHTFKERGPEARFDNENVDAVYSKKDDVLHIFVASVGDQPIDKFHLKVKITPPGGKVAVKNFEIGPPRESFPGGGAQHNVKIPNFKKSFPAKPTSTPVSEYKLEAFFLERELGDDFFHGKIKEE